jgi:N-methylhydantoinase A
MARALRAVSTERGRDPRELAMLAFGGNGPVHAATLARMLDIRRILVPPVPGLFSALGMLFPEVEHHYVRTCKQRLDRMDAPALQRIETLFRALEADGAAALAEEGFAAAVHRFERLVDLRYAGANSELTLPFAAQDAGPALREHFGAAHAQQYGYRSDDEVIETMNVLVISRASTGKAQVPDALSFGDGAPPAAGARPVYFGPAFGAVSTPICGRGDLGAQWQSGPLLVEEFDSTTVVPPDGRARRIAWDTIEIELE